METRSLIAWQKKFLLIMIGMLAVLTLFFFIVSLIQLYYLHRRIEENPMLISKVILGMLEKDGAGIPKSSSLDFVRWKTLSLLEENALARRYHQADVSLMSRISMRYLGFGTGMILALVGAAFILEKLKEPETKLDVEEEGVGKFLIKSHSPGLILVLLGVILMVTTIITQHEIKVNDSPLYTSNWVTGGGVVTEPAAAGAKSVPAVD